MVSKYLKTFKKIYLLKIDSLKIKPDFLVTKINNQLGFETVVNIKNIPEGKHFLKINRFKKETISELDITIPFWYFKQ